MNESPKYWKLFKRCSSVLSFCCTLHLKSTSQIAPLPHVNWFYLILKPIASTSVYIFVTGFNCQLSCNEPQYFHCCCPNWMNAVVIRLCQNSQPSVGLTVQSWFYIYTHTCVCVCMCVYIYNIYSWDMLFGCWLVCVYSSDSIMRLCLLFCPSHPTGLILLVPHIFHCDERVILRC
jgi:hypothetical protein